MNALAVQNPRHKCDLGNNLRMIQSLTSHKEITADNICNNNYYNYYTEIILYLCVCALQLTLEVLLSI